MRSQHACHLLASYCTAVKPGVLPEGLALVRVLAQRWFELQFCVLLLSASVVEYMQAQGVRKAFFVFCLFFRLQGGRTPHRLATHNAAE
jgi:hypothetical protein